MAVYLPHPTYKLLVGDDGTIIGPSGKTLKLRISNCGYSRVVVYPDGQHKSVSVHRLVAETFLPNTDEQVNHKDGNKANNCVGNLEWCSRSHNVRHALDTGLLDPRKNAHLKGHKGEANCRAKLTQAQVNEIRTLYDKPRVRGSKPWDNYGISKVMFYNILRRDNWR